MVEVFHVGSFNTLKTEAVAHPFFTSLDPVTRLGGFEAGPGSFMGGVRVAMADVNGDGFLDFVTGLGYGGGGRVTIFDGASYALQKFAAVSPFIAVTSEHGTTGNPTVLESFSPGFAPGSSAALAAIWVAGTTPVPSVPPPIFF